MAHDIDFSTGSPAIAYAGKRPWHGFGEKLDEQQSIETWLRAARLEWELKRLPVQYFVDGKLRTMDDRFVLVRSDTESALSVVSGDYQIVQPQEVLEFYRDLVREYGYTLETAGALNGGRKVWALARTGISGAVDKQGEDIVAAYLLLATSCDKTLATTAAFTSIRVVCQNTLFFAVEDIKTGKRPHIKVPHTARFEAKQIKDQLGLLGRAWSEFMTKADRMAQHPMKIDATATFIAEILGQTSDKPLSSRAQAEHQTIMALFTSAPGQQMSTAKETLWGVVNAVTYYADHAKSGVDRLDSSWFGAGVALKDKAWAKANVLVASPH